MASRRADLMAATVALRRHQGDILWPAAAALFELDRRDLLTRAVVVMSRPFHCIARMLRRISTGNPPLKQGGYQAGTASEEARQHCGNDSDLDGD